MDRNAKCSRCCIIVSVELLYAEVNSSSVIVFKGVH